MKSNYIFFSVVELDAINESRDPPKLVNPCTIPKMTKPMFIFLILKLFFKL